MLTATPGHIQGRQTMLTGTAKELGEIAADWTRKERAEAQGKETWRTPAQTREEG